jgi:hypothetical protein
MRRYGLFSALLCAALLCFSEGRTWEPVKSQNPCETWEKKVAMSDYIFQARIDKVLEKFNPDAEGKEKKLIPTRYVVTAVMKGKDLKVADTFIQLAYPYPFGGQSRLPFSSQYPLSSKPQTFFASKTTPDKGNTFRIMPVCGGLYEAFPDTIDEILNIMKKQKK